MKTRHLAAVLLEVLWYMLTPPLGKDGRINSAAPLAQWHRGLAFSVKGSCVDELDTELLRATRDKTVSPSALAQLKSAICIPADDPRLGKSRTKDTD